MTTVTSFGSDVRCLSSGTMSKLLRDMYFTDLAEYLKSRYSLSRRRLDVNPIQAKDDWIIGRVQIAFARFADVCHDEVWKSWMDVWNAYLKAIGTVHFKLSYMGESEWIDGRFSLLDQQTGWCWQEIKEYGTVLKMMQFILDRDLQFQDEEYKRIRRLDGNEWEAELSSGK